MSHRAANSAENALIIGSDQVATLNGIHIGKPGDHASALKQLQLMRGKVVFHTALASVGPPRRATRRAIARRANHRPLP
jgi:septum formation protein